MQKKSMNMKMSTKLPASIIALSTATAGLTAFMAYEHSASSLREQANSNLDSVLRSQEANLENWFHAIENNMETMKSNPTVHAALKDFSAAWLQLGDSPTAYLQNAYIHSNPHPIGA